MSRPANLAELAGVEACETFLVAISELNFGNCRISAKRSGHALVDVFIQLEPDAKRDFGGQVSLGYNATIRHRFQSPALYQMLNPAFFYFLFNLRQVVMVVVEGFINLSGG